MMKKSGKYSVTVSKETRENKNLIDMACLKIGDRKKSFYVAIALIILVLSSTIFAPTFWQLTSRNTQVEKNGNFSTTKTESSKMTITSYTLNVKRQLDEIACSQIIVSSNLAMHEQFSKLFGAYERLGLKNGRMMYINWKTNSRLFYGNYIYHNNYYDNHTETEEYRTKWALFSDNYIAFDINCNDLMPTNSNCKPEWRFCNYSFLEVLELNFISNYGVGQ